MGKSLIDNDSPCDVNGDVFQQVTFSGDTITDHDLYISTIELH